MRALSCTSTDTGFCVRISGKGKRGRVFVRFAKCTTARGMANEGDEELGEREKERRIGRCSSRGDGTKSRIVVLPFYHLTGRRGQRQRP